MVFRPYLSPLLAKQITADMGKTDQVLPTVRRFEAASVRHAE